MRCLALGEAWARFGGQVTFIGQCPEFLKRRGKEQGMGFLDLTAIHPDPADIEETLAAVGSLSRKYGREPWVIVDGYQFDADYVDKLHAAHCPSIVIDDLALLRRYSSDVVVNPGPAASPLSYNASPDTVLLLGSDYVLLRAEFSRWSSWKRAIASEARRIVISFGGSDPVGMTLKTLQAVNQIEMDALEVVAIAGEQNPNFRQIVEVAAQSRHSVRVLSRVDDMPEIMAWADLAVTAGGGTCLESAFMGLPSLTIGIAENQLDNLYFLDRQQAALYQGWHEQVDAGRLASTIRELCLDPERRRKMSCQGRSLVDGEGPERVCRVVAALQARRIDLAEGRVRLAKASDAVPIWTLANEPAVRANSFNSDPIPLDEHMKWFQAKLASASTRFWVFEIGGVIAATIRYERVNADAAELSFAVRSAFRGKGIGSALLETTSLMAARELGVPSVTGLVLESNPSSARAFEKAGFVCVGSTGIQGKGSFQFRRNMA